MSANGSPLAIFGGARATFGVDDGADAAPLIQVALQGGEEVDLSDAQSVAGLAADAREEARGKLQGLQVKLCYLYLLRLIYAPPGLNLHYNLCYLTGPAARAPTGTCMSHQAKQGGSVFYGWLVA